jgi:hypothetical protein
VEDQEIQKADLIKDIDIIGKETEQIYANADNEIRELLVKIIR